MKSYLCSLPLLERPYKDDSTASRLLSEVKHLLARLVLRWGTTLESRERPYKDDSTASRLLSEVKHLLARLVLRWGTTLESRKSGGQLYNVAYSSVPPIIFGRLS
eukprot:scaffold34863_cov55-Attheya_sp.AAC.3